MHKYYSDVGWLRMSIPFCVRSIWILHLFSLSVSHWIHTHTMLYKQIWDFSANQMNEFVWKTIEAKKRKLKCCLLNETRFGEFSEIRSDFTIFLDKISIQDKKKLVAMGTNDLHKIKWTAYAGNGAIIFTHFTLLFSIEWRKNWTVLYAID